jgi:hypothetical protein
MKLILHHLLKDIRAQRWLLLLWGLVLLVPILLNALVLQPDYDSARYIETLRESPLAMVITVIVGIILVARVIQSDPVTGSTSFWLTRPIPTRVYIPSKLIFLVLFIILPEVLLSLLWGMQFQETPEMVWSNLATLFVIILIGGSVVVWLATYTPSLIYFAGMLCAGFVGLFLFVISYSAKITVPGTTPMVLTTDRFIDIFIPGLFLSLIVQHWRRRGRAGLMIGLATIVIAPIAQIAFPVWTIQTPPKIVGTGKIVRIDFSPDWQNHVFWGRPTLIANAILTPVPADDDSGLLIQSVSGEFQLPGEDPTKLSISDPYRFMFSIQRQLKPLALAQKALPDILLTRPNHQIDFCPPVNLFSLTSAQNDLLQGRTGTLVLNLAGVKMSLIKRAAIPLNQPQFIARIPGGFIRVAPLSPVDHASLSIWKVEPERTDLSPEQDMVYVLVNPANHTGTIVNSNGNSSSSNGLGGGFSRVSSVSTVLVGNSEPLEQKVLYIFQAMPGDSFVSTLTAPNFTMNPKGVK